LNKTNCHILFQEIFELLQFGFIILFTLFLFECIDYDVLFHNSDPHRADYKPGNKTLISDVIRDQCVARFSFPTWLCLLLALAFWCTRALATFYHFFQYWDIKSFYNVALRITDAELDSITWHEVQQRLIKAQGEYSMCIHKSQLTELDIYHRILRFKNYMVAMVNKDLLPVRILVPFGGETVFLSNGLKFNLEFLFFKGPWAPFNQFHLKDEFKKASKKKELVEQFQNKVALLALVNLLLMPLVLVWQILHCFFNYVEVIKREPGSLGVRKWSQYGRIYLRHLNELDHEFKGRLNRAYKPANKYLELFVSPLCVVVWQNVAFIAGSVLAVLIVLSVWDEDVLNVEHGLTVMTALGAIVAFSRGFIPDDNLVFCPEKLLTAVVAHTHYFPDVAWKGQAHTKKTMVALAELFPLTADYLLQELISPIVTPFVLFFSLRPKAAAVIDFFRNHTVHVEGVGDICFFAQMDIRRHGNPDWQPTAVTQNHSPMSDSATEQMPPPLPSPKSNNYTQAEDGKTEMSLIHFTLTNPDWKPPSEAEQFITNFRGNVAKDAEALPTLHEENMGDNPLLSSLHSLDAAGAGGAGDIYSSLAKDILNDARMARIEQAAREAVEDSMQSSMAPQLHQPSGSLLQSVHLGLTSASGGRLSSMMASSHFGSAPLPPNSLFNSRLVGSSLEPPPNLRHDLRRLGLEFSEADMSLSALYLHEVHHHRTTLSSRLGASRIAKQQQQIMQRRASLNELDEDNLPLVEPGSPRLATSTT
jgi:autophagy-related protein 9